MIRPALAVITIFYDPEPNMITASVAQALTQKFDVTVVTVHPNYPLGKFYKGSKFWSFQRSLENGVVVWRVPFFPNHSKSIVLRAISYLSFTLAVCIVAPIVCQNPKVVWVYQTPFSAGLAALWFRFVKRSKIVYTAADLWPESLLAANVAKPGILVNLLSEFSKWINRFADTIICATQGTLARYRRDGINPKRLKYVPLWVDGSPTCDSSRRTVSDSCNKLGLVYAGNLGPAQNLSVVLDACALLQKKGIIVPITFLGSGSEEAVLKKKVNDLQLESVHFEGKVSPIRAIEACKLSIAQIVCLAPAPQFDFTVPSKLPFSFAMGKPILAGLRGEAASLAQESQGAFVFNSADAQSLADAIEKLLATHHSERLEMGDRLIKFYLERFEKNKLLSEYVQILGSEI